MKKLSILKRVVAVVLAVVLCSSMLVGAVTPTELNKGIEKPTNTLKTNGNGGKTDIGTWFMTYNNNNMWGSNFGSGYPIKFRTLMPDGSYGILDSSNIEHIDFQLKQIADAKIDFIIYDLTNGGLCEEMGFAGYDAKGYPNDQILKNAILTCERIAEWNKNNEWQLKYCLAVGVYSQITKGAGVGAATEWQAKATYEMFYQNEVYGGDNYYQVDGKPMLIIFDWAFPAIEDWDNYGGDRTYGDKFFVRGAQEGNVGTYGWHTEMGSIPTEEVVVVCPGHDTAGAGPVDVARANGTYYRSSWETVLNTTLPRIIVITSFNDYNEQTAVWIADSSNCREGVEEKWTDPTGRLNPSMYWDMTKEGIRLVRTFNGDVKGKFESQIFKLGNPAPAKASSSNTTVIVIVIAAVAVFVVTAVVVTIILLTKKPAKKKK